MSGFSPGSHLISTGTSGSIPCGSAPGEGNQGDFPGGVERVNPEQDRKHQLAQRLPATTRVPEGQDGVQESLCPTMRLPGAVLTLWKWRFQTWLWQGVTGQCVTGSLQLHLAQHQMLLAESWVCSLIYCTVPLEIK